MHPIIFQLYILALDNFNKYTRSYFYFPMYCFLSQKVTTAKQINRQLQIILMMNQIKIWAHHAKVNKNYYFAVIPAVHVIHWMHETNFLS